MQFLVISTSVALPAWAICESMASFSPAVNGSCHFACGTHIKQCSTLQHPKFLLCNYRSVEHFSNNTIPANLIICGFYGRSCCWSTAPLHTSASCHKTSNTARNLQGASDWNMWPCAIHKALWPRGQTMATQIQVTLHPPTLGRTAAHIAVWGTVALKQHLPRLPAFAKSNLSLDI